MAKILIVDDEAGIRRQLKKLLELEGHKVDTAATIKEAQAWIKNNIADVVLLDLKLPDGGGAELLEDIQAMDVGSVVLIMSGHVSAEEAVGLTRRGAIDVLEKPIMPEKILSVLQKAIAERESRQQHVFAHQRPTGQSHAWHNTCSQVERFAPSHLPIILLGKSGVGKEVLSHYIHDLSKRKGDMIAVNCAALPDSLLENELFGHEEGAFTGANKAFLGRFREADNGTLFLDEIGEMGPSAQAKLLRVLESGVVRPLGGMADIPINVRLIAATHQDLQSLVAKGTFRADLYYRLNVLSIDIPTLAERMSDIPLLAQRFLAEYAQSHQRKMPHLTPDAMEYLQKQPWEGNVRELKNSLFRLLALSDLNEFNALDIQKNLGWNSDPNDDYIWPVGAYRQFKMYKAAAEIAFIREKLSQNKGNISKTAERIDMARSQLYRKIEEYNLEDLTHE